MAQATVLTLRPPLCPTLDSVVLWNATPAGRVQCRSTPAALGADRPRRSEGAGRAEGHRSGGRGEGRGEKEGSSRAGGRGAVQIACRLCAGVGRQGRLCFCFCAVVSRSVVRRSDLHTRASPLSLKGVPLLCFFWCAFPLWQGSLREQLCPGSVVFDGTIRCFCRALYTTPSAERSGSFLSRVLLSLECPIPAVSANTHIPSNGTKTRLSLCTCKMCCAAVVHRASRSILQPCTLRTAAARGSIWVSRRERFTVR